MSSLLTDYLTKKASGILKVLPEVNDASGYYTMFDDGAVSITDAELLYGLVKIIQPEAILETGTFTGVSSLYMGQALKENGHGHLTTIEHENTHKLRAEKLWKLCEVSNQVTCVLQSSADFKPQGEYDLFFLDSELELRWGELIAFFPHLKPGGYVLIHDFHRHLYKGSKVESLPDFEDWPTGPVPEQIKEWVRQDKLRVTHFGTPRGMTLLYKTHPEDYKWE